MIDDCGKIHLNDYDLWIDGSISVDPKNVKRFIRTVPHDVLFVTDATADSVKKFNSISSFVLKEKTELDVSKIDPSFNLPQEYNDMDVSSYLSSLSNKIRSDDPLYQKRISRLKYEIEIFRLRGHFDIIKLLKYVVDVLNDTNTVWGVGRGSSCSSYILFLMGLHLVDVVRFDIDLHDFIK